MIITLQFSNGNNRGIVVESETTIQEIRESFLIGQEKNCNISYDGHILTDTIKISNILNILPESNTIPPLLMIEPIIEDLFAIQDNVMHQPFNGSVTDEPVNGLVENGTDNLINNPFNDLVGSGAELGHNNLMESFNGHIEPSAPPAYEHVLSDQITVSLKFLNGNTKTIQIGLDKNVADIKKKNLFVTDDNIDDVKLIYSGRILTNNQKISDLCFTANSFIVVLTSSKLILDKMSQENSTTNDYLMDDVDDETSSNLDEMELIDGDLFENGVSDEEQDEEKVDNKETILKNNEKFLELIKDDQFKILINIILNKPEYISYALTFVQSGMLFFKPEQTDDESNDYSEQLATLKELNICDDDEKMIKIIELASGDLQIAIRFLFQSQHDDKLLTSA
jgi:hypothetical protein